MKIKLQVGVTTAFTLIVVIMLGVTIAFLYYSSRNLALNTARSQMAAAQDRTANELRGVLAPVVRAVGSTAGFFKAFPERAQTYNGVVVMESQIRGLPQVYGLYFGVEESGNFFQVVKCLNSLETFGPDSNPVPAETQIVYRATTGKAGSKRDTYLYNSELGKLARRESVTTTFDPRKRPWYEGARLQEGIFNTQLYKFTSTGQPGVTFSLRALNDNGELLGVVGADLTMDQIGDILNSIRIGGDGQVFLLDRNDDVLAYTGTRNTGTEVHFQPPGGTEGTHIEDPIVAQALANWKATKDEFYRFSVGGGRYHLASVAPLTDVSGIVRTLGLIVPEDEFVGAIKSTTAKVLKIVAIILILSIVVIILVARLLSHQLHKAALEAEKISHFDLDGGFQLKSGIYEVEQLGAAISGMKSSLKSFGAYVPKDIVKSIVASGEPVTIGGTSRDVTIMFSDIEGFTAKSEKLSPADLMTDLSAYLTALEARITANGGTIDKYIGDAIMAFWNAPKSDPEHAVNGCRTILDCITAEIQLNEFSKDSQLTPLRTRFGLHCDRVVVGNVGSSNRFQYTALGAAVNLASRTEGLNKLYGTQALVTGNIARETDGRFLLRFVDRVSPAGTTQPTDIFELLNEIDTPASQAAGDQWREEVEAWHECMRQFEGRHWQDALSALELQRSRTSNQRLVLLYIERCKSFLRSPPAADWDGSFSIDSK